MATRYPGALDRDPNEIPDNIADSDTLDSPNHATIHNNVNGAVLQIEEKLGIGDTTASAGALLHGTAAGTSAWSADPSVVGSLSVAKDSAAAIFNLTAHHDTEATAAQLTLRKTEGSAASPSGPVDDDAVLGKIMFQGYDGNSYATGAVIQALADGTPADGDMPTELLFQVTPDGGSETPATALTISPAKKATFAGAIEVDGAAQFDSTLTVGVDDTGYDVIFYGATTANGYFWWDESTDSLIVGPAGHLSFGETAPTWPVEFATDDDLTSFTGTGKGGVCITNSQYDANDFTALDFSYTGTDNAVARIAAKITGGGSELHFGTSGNYGNGIENTAMVITKDGFVGIGTTMGADMPSNDGTLSVKSTNAPVLAVYRVNSASTNVNSWFVSDYSSTGTIHCKIYNDGDIQNTNNSYGALSDARLKTTSAARDYYEDLRKLEVVNYQMVKTNKVTYEYDDDGNKTDAEPTMELVDTNPETRKKLLGLVAQDVEKIMPGLVGEGDDGYKNLKYSVLTPMLLQAFQKLADKVEALEG